MIKWTLSASLVGLMALSLQAESVRYVATTGSDTADGLTSATPMASIAAAVASLGSAGGTVYVAKGTYAETGSTLVSDGLVSGNTAVYLAAPAQVIGATGKAEDVIVTRGAQSVRIFTLNHADALVRYVTVKDGYINDTRDDQLGGNVAIGSAGGTVADCVLTDGETRKWAAGGGNLGMLAGRVTRCVIRAGRIQNDTPNAGRQCGANVCMKGGVLENSLITAGTNGFGSVALYGSARLANCTVTKNRGTASAGVAILDKGETVRVSNCIISGNTCSSDVTGFGPVFASYWNNALVQDATTLGVASSRFVDCLADLEINANCIVADPWFADPDNGDYRITAGSPAVDVVNDYEGSGAISGTDLAGNARSQGRSRDLGCYELDASTFSVGFEFCSDGSLAPAPLICRAGTVAAQGPVTYYWDFDGDGVADRTTSDTEFVRADMPAGVYTATVWASDGTQTVYSPRTTSVNISPDVVYVAQDNASAQKPYGTPETAAASLADAVEFAGEGTTIRLLPGLFKTVAPVSVSKGVRIVGDDADPARVVISNTITPRFNVNQNARVLILDHKQAMVSGVTLRNGWSFYFKDGGNLCISSNGGTASNCVLTAGFSTYNSNGAAFSLAGGLLTHCWIVGNSSDRSGSNGITDPGAIFAASGKARIENCLFAHNDTTGQSHLGRLEGTVQVRNCTFVDYTAPESCDDTYGGRYLLYVKSGSPTVEDCVFMGNYLRDTTTPIPFKGSLSGYRNCVYDGVADFPADSGCICNAKVSAFNNYASGDYTPKYNGILHNAGLLTNHSEATAYASYPSVDLLGNPRKIGKAIDIGCFETKTRLMYLSLR